AGNWTCTGIAFAGDMGPEHPTKATVHTAWILDDKWLRVDYKESKTTKNAHPIAAELLMTYNEAEKKIASGCIDNMGGYCTEEARLVRRAGQLLLDDPPNLGQLQHQVRLVVQTPSCINDYYSCIARLGRRDRVVRHRGGVRPRLVLDHRHAYPIGPMLQLLDG